MRMRQTMTLTVTHQNVIGEAESPSATNDDSTTPHPWYQRYESSLLGTLCFVMFLSMQVILGPASKDLLKVQLQPLSDPGGLRSHVAANWTQEARDGFARHFFVDFFFPLSYVAFIHARARAEFQPAELLRWQDREELAKA